MFRITRRIGPICASHQLARLPQGHPCQNWHGHNFYIHVTVSARELTPEGWIVDFTDLDPLETYLQTWPQLVGGLNALLSDRDPTVEYLAQHIASWCGENLTLANGWVSGVRVEETEYCSAEYLLEEA